MVPGSGNGRRLDSRSSRSSHDSPRLLIPEKKHSMDNKRFSKATPPPSPQDIEGSRRPSKSQRSQLQLYSHSETNRKGWKGSSWLASGRMADAEILLAGRRASSSWPHTRMVATGPERGRCSRVVDGAASPLTFNHSLDFINYSR